METFPPSPPPPPPLIEVQPPIQSTFIEQWLDTAEVKSPRKTEREYTEYFARQFLFPRYIPQSVLCNVDPILNLISHHVRESDGDNGNRKKGQLANITSEEKIPEQRTALDDLREIVSLCATYKSRSVLNRNEFHHKRAMMLKEKQVRDQSSIVAYNVSSSPGDPQSMISTPSPPPYHAEYTPLKLQENFLLAKIHAANYNLCLANAICPDRMQRLLSCWRGSDPQWVKTMEKQGMESYVCLDERGAVERCVGLGVQRVMKDILE